MTVSRCRTIATLLAAAWMLSSRAFADTFSVVNLNDSGTGSLHQAILDANAHPGDDVIQFVVPGTGPYEIHVTAPLPVITDPVILDGYTQPGTVPNTAPPGSGLNSFLEIQIDGAIQVGVGGPNMIVRGLAIRTLSLSGIGGGATITNCYLGFDQDGINEHGSGLAISNVISGSVQVGPSNLISALVVGPDAPATAVRGNIIGLTRSGAGLPIGGFGGIQVSGSSGVVIGGPNPADRNVIDGGVDDMGDAPQLQIVGNFFGTDVTGTHSLGGSELDLASASATVQGNVIGGNGTFAIFLGGGAQNSVIQGNFIGTDLTATLGLGHFARGGVAIEAFRVTFGGTAPGQGNVVAFCPSDGFFSALTVTVGAMFDDLRGNRIFANKGIGIDLDDGTLSGSVTPNDPGDVDEGSNGLQNFPIITQVVPGASTTHIEGTLNSLPPNPGTGFLGHYDIDLFSNPCARRPRALLEGENYLGSVAVTTDGFGNASFAVDVPGVLGPGDEVTATATDELGDTSEFSQRLVFSVEPLTAPPGQTQDVTIHGMRFEQGSTVTVGGLPATNVTATSPTTITATMPAFAAGTVHGLSVTLPGGFSSTLPNGWMADFADMPSSDPYHDAVVHLVTNSIAAGVGNGLYGGDEPTTREQMAVFLLKGRHGACYVPPHCTGVFGDVPCPSLFADWIEALAAEGVTAGCGNGDYCPHDPVTREQMAVFLLKAKYDSAFAPTPCMTYFTDVACPSQYADWIWTLFSEHITAGCADHEYCPERSVLRKEMAVFLNSTFLLP